jgi:predicted GNAT family acetyltransferase
VIEVRDQPDESRFEIVVDGEAAGFAVYRRRPGRILFVHTEIDPGFEGRGLGGQLAAAALDAVRVTGERVVPLCPFIAGYIDKHPEYQDLVDTRMMEILTSGE